MKFRRNLALALKLVRRDWISGELTVLAAALLIAVAGATTVSLFGHRLTRTMETQAAEFLAADLVVSSRESPPEEWFAKAGEWGLRWTRTVEFPSVLVENGELLLVGAKAVDAGYPLRGVLRTSLAGLTDETPADRIPEPGAAWVDQRVLNSLNLAIGDTVALGEKSLKLARVVTHEPDRKGDLYSLSPRILFNRQDLDATGVIRPGSNARFYALFAGDQAKILAFKRWLKPRLPMGDRLADIHEDRPELGNALTRAERYLGLSSTVIVLIAGVAIAMSARRYTERHYDLTALLKCMGAGGRDILQIHLTQYLVIGIAASALGCFAGFLAQAGLAEWLKGIISHDLSPPAWYAPFFGMAVGMFVLLGFALPPVLRLRRLPPLRVLRRNLLPLPSSAWTVYGLALATVGILLWRYTGDARMTALVLGIALAVLAATGLCARSALRALRRLSPYLSLPWRLGLQQLTRSPNLGATQILAFGLTLTAMLISLLARTELVSEWRRQLPANAPNYFALNLFDNELPAFREFMERHELSVSDYYPIVRGRLTAVNGVDARAIAAKDSQGEGAISRDLSLTWRTDPPADNRLKSGQWWGQESPPGLVSVEEKLAESLRIRVGDTLTFSLGGKELTATVASLRSLRWETMRPNFYMIFTPPTLKGFPATWLTSFYLPQHKKPDLVELAKRFPSMTLLEVDQLLRQFQDILKQITLSIEFLLAFALAAGIAVLSAAVQSTLDVRMREDALLRAMGASRKMLRKSLALEFVCLGLFSGLLAAFTAESIAWALFVRVFELQPRIHWEIWAFAPVTGAFAIGVLGYWHTRSLFKTSPMKILRELEE